MLEAEQALLAQIESRMNILLNLADQFFSAKNRTANFQNICSSSELLSRPWIRFLGNTSSTFVALGFDFGQSVFFSRLICYFVVVSAVLDVPAAAVVVVVVVEAVVRAEVLKLLSMLQLMLLLLLL